MRARAIATSAALVLAATVARAQGAGAAGAGAAGAGVPGAGAGDAAHYWDTRITIGRVEHRVDAGFGVGVSKGTVLGVAAHVGRWSLVELDAHAWGGQLKADDVARDDRKVGELGVQASVPAMPWLAFVGSATVRGVDAAPAMQRWTQLGAGAELRFAFADGMLQSVLHASLLPRVSVSGGADPDLGVAGGAGLKLQHKWLQASLAYAVERYDFPPQVGGEARREQLSGLQVGIGMRW